MINKATILSNYNDRLTLLQWLKKVELALQNASAKEFRVNQLGNATLTFSIVFDDNTELTTGPIVLQQGESVASASITDGHLLLTLTNGDVLDAGDVGAVSSFSVDASQHLIVTYQNGTSVDLGSVAVRFENIEDANGHKRFAEGEITFENIPDVTKTYAKWSLSGSHLMIVIAGTIDTAMTISSGTLLCKIDLPQWIKDKIYPIRGVGISWSTFMVINDDWSTLNNSVLLSKESNEILVKQDGNVTFSQPATFRYQFDLLIDNN